MNRIAILVGVVAIVVLAFGCADDIVLPEDVPLIGTYEGSYTFVENYGGTDETEFIQDVRFVFTDKFYYMTLDINEGDEDTVCFCNVDGEYALTDGVRLKEAHWRTIGVCSSCNPEQNPAGTFVRETQGNALVLKLREGTSYKELRLVRVPDEAVQ